MRIDIVAEVKFSHVADGEYLVRLQGADQTIIGKLLRADGGWKSYSIEQDGSWKGSFRAFGTTRNEASYSLLEAYELANGLRDPEGRRVMKELETNLWYVAEFTGVRRSSRWTDKADAVAKLASLQPTDFEQIGRQAALDDKPAAPISNPEVRFALAGRTVGDPENLRIMQAFQKGYEAERTAQADEAVKGFTKPEYDAAFDRAMDEGTSVDEAHQANLDEAAHDMPASDTDGPFYDETDEAVQASRADQDRAIREMLASHQLKAVGFDLVPLGKTGNEYAADAYQADQEGDMAAALWAVLQAWRVEPGQADRWRKLLRSYRGLPAVPSGTPLDDRGDVVEVIPLDASQITPVLVWSDGTVTGGMKELTDRLTGQAYGHDTDEFALYVTQGGALYLASTRQLSQETDANDWINEQYGVYVSDAAEPVLVVNLRIDGRA